MFKKIFFPLFLLVIFETFSVHAATTQTTSDPNLDNFNHAMNNDTPIKYDKNQFALAVGLNGMISNKTYSGGDGGLNLGLEYTHDFNKNIGLFVGANTSINFIGGVVSSFITNLVVNDTTTIDLNYGAYPVAIQFTLPLDNNELYARAGANIFSLEQTSTYYKNNDPHNGVTTKTSQNGVGFYGALGWQYNFGLTSSRNWSIGLSYQYYRMKQYNINQYILSLGYRF